MSAPFTREQQIEFMVTAKERMEARMQGWLQEPEIKRALRLSQRELQEQQRREAEAKLARRPA